MKNFANTIKVLIGRLCQPLLALILFTVLARLLTKQEFGKYSLIISLFTGLTTFFTLGVDLSMPYFLPKNKNKKRVFSTATKIITALIITMIVLVLVSNNAFQKLYGLNNQDVLLIILGGAAAITYRFTGYSLQGIKKFAKLMWNNVTYRLGSLTAIPLVILGLNYGGAVVGEVIGYALSGILSFYWLRKLVTKKNSGDMTKKILTYSLLIYLSSIGTFFLFNFMKWYAALINIEWVAEIDVAYRLGSLTSLIPVSIMTVFLPEFSENQASQKLLGLSTKWVVIVGLLSMLVAIPNTETILTLVFSQKYANITLTTQLFFTAFFLAGVNYILNAFVLADEKQKYNVLITGTQAIVMTPLLIILLPTHGVLGTGTAILASYVVAFMMYLALLSRKKIKFPYKKTIKAILAFTLAYLLTTINPYTGLAKTLFNLTLPSLLFAALIVASRTVTVKEIKDLLNQIIPNKK